MELIRRRTTPVVQDIAYRIERFTLVDVGCGGGIDRAWRDFGNRLQGIGFDPQREEVERLARIETNPRIRYVPGYVGRRPGYYWQRNPRPRLSLERAFQIRDTGHYALPPVADQEPLPPPVDVPDDNAIQLPQFLTAEGLTDVDFIKIDIDGADYYVLHSLREFLRSARVLGMVMEVNFFGSEEPNQHTFHNTDRFMRARGFELFGLTLRRYSSAAQPTWPFLQDTPGGTTWGRPWQGDALYVRDFGWRLSEADPADYTPEKLVKLVALFALFNLPDQAAETIARFRDDLRCLIDLDKTLNLLAQQIEEGPPSPKEG